MKKLQRINLYSLIAVYDFEDSKIELNEHNCLIEIFKDGEKIENIDITKKDNNLIQYTIFDSDKNSVDTQVNVTIIPKETTTQSTNNSHTFLNMENLKIPEETMQYINFKDVKKSDYWAYKSIKFMNELGVLNGYNGQFLPKNNITRADTVIMLVKVLGLNPNEELLDNFSDVSKNKYYYNYVALAKKYGMVNGDEYGQFYPEKNIKREDVAVIINNILENLNLIKDTKDTKFTKFKDIKQTCYYAKQSLINLINIEIIKDDSNGNLNPKNYISRAEMPVIIERLYIFLKNNK